MPPKKITIAQILILAPVLSEKSCNDHRNADRTTKTRIAYQTAHFPNQPMLPLEAQFFSKKDSIIQKSRFLLSDGRGLK